MDLKEELQPFFKLLSALLFMFAGIGGLITQRFQRSGAVWLEGTPAIVVASVVLLIGLGLSISWVNDRGWFRRSSE